MDQDAGMEVGSLVAHFPMTVMVPFGLFLLACIAAGHCSQTKSSGGNVSFSFGVSSCGIPPQPPYQQSLIVLSFSLLQHHCGTQMEGAQPHQLPSSHFCLLPRVVQGYLEQGVVTDFLYNPTGLPGRTTSRVLVSPQQGEGSQALGRLLDKSSSLSVKDMADLN
jgi:hypothetical protein